MKKIISLLIVMSSMVFGLNIARADNLYEGLAGCWTFDNIIDVSIKDESGNGYDGEYNGSVVLSEGKSGDAIEFSKDSADFINLGKNTLNKSLSNAGAITFSAWMNIKSMPEKGSSRIFYTPVINGNAGFEVYISGGALRVGTRSNPSDSWYYAAYNIPAGFINKWHHFVITADFENNDILFYIDGENTSPSDKSKSIEYGSKTYAPGNATAFDYIGGNGKAGQTVDALMDEIRVYSKKLTQSEIDSLVFSDFNVGEINFYNNNSDIAETIGSGKLVSRIKLNNPTTKAVPVKILMCLYKKGTNTMTDIVTKDVNCIPMSNETAEISVNVPDFPEDYYATVMVWDSVEYMQSYAAKIIK